MLFWHFLRGCGRCGVVLWGNVFFLRVELCFKSCQDVALNVLFWGFLCVDDVGVYTRKGWM